MFVAPRSVLPPDFTFPNDLKGLGYFINENDEIRSINKPDQPFRYRVNVNERYNEVRKEALNACTRETVLTRLRQLGLQKLRLPIGSTETTPHVPILVTPSIFTSKRVVVVFGEPTQDLAIWSYRTVGSKTVNEGSMVNFAREVLEKGDEQGERPGLLIANLGQLVWYCRGQRAVSLTTWEALPRTSAVETSCKMTARNEIPGNHTWSEHVEYIFREVLEKMIPKTTKFSILGVAEGCIGTVDYLSENWSQWENRITSICMADPPTYMPYHCAPAVAEFISKRARAYVMSNEQIDTPIPGRAQLGVNCYSAGLNDFVECIVPTAYRSMLKWLDIMHANPRLEERALMSLEDENGEGQSLDTPAWGGPAPATAQVEEV